MHLNPYGHDAVVLAVTLANDPPSTPEELHRRCVDAGLVLDRTTGREDLAAIRDLLTRWTAIVDAPDAATRAALLNALLAATTAHPRLTDHAGDWHLHYRDDGLGPAGILRAVVATGTALHLVGRGMDRLGRCAAEGCERIFADVSRNGTQRYCTPACANRSAVARHRSRSSGKPPSCPQRA